MPWTNPTGAWLLHDPVWESDLEDPERATGMWNGHRWFVYDLLTWRSPKTVVELGTHWGPSLFAMAQAVKDGSLEISLTAVDTWAGDEHTGEYDESVINTVRRIREARFDSENIALLRTSFEEACGQFDNESIDLLHIDGFHSYEACKNDFNLWLPKLAPNGLVLLHDASPDTGYGSAEFCEELLKRYPGFSFPHSCGLAVVAPKGTTGWGDFFSDRARELMLAYYPAKATAFLAGIQVRDQAAMIEDRDEAITAQTAMIEDRDEAITAQTAMIDDRDNQLRKLEEKLGDLEQLVSRQDELVAALRASGVAAELDQRSAMTATDLTDQQRVAVIMNQAARLSQFQAEMATIRMQLKRARRRNRIQQRRIKDVELRLLKQRRSPKAAAKVILKYGPKSLVKRIRPHGIATRSREPGLAPGNEFLGGNKDPALMLPALTTLKASFDDAHYRSIAALPSGISSEEVWNHFLDVGLPHGTPLNADHGARAGTERRIAGARPGDDPSEARIVTADGLTETLALPLENCGIFDGAALVSFDLWDTLIERSRPADSAKLATARRMKRRFATNHNIRSRSEWALARERVEIEAQLARSRDHEEYSALEVLALQLARHGVCEGDPLDLARHLVDAEVEDEIRYSRPRSDVVGAPTHPERTVIISDFYLGSEDLKRIVAGVRPEWSDIEVIASVDLKASKRKDGSLFKLVRTERGIAASDHIHVGDNLHSDVKMQLHRGGVAVHVEPPHGLYPAPGALTPAFSEDALDAWEGYANSMLPPASSPGRASGRRWAFLPASLVAGAVDEAISVSAGRVFYLSREGQFLRDVHKAMGVNSSIYRETAPDHLEVSRRSTFGPSLTELSHRELMRLWSMYGSQSIRAFCASVGLDPDIVVPMAARYGLDLNADIPQIADDERFRRLLSDDEFVEVGLASVREQRGLLRAYLLAKFQLERGEAVVCDVGWRGSIQDNIAKVIDQPTVGVYLGLFPFLNEQPSNTRKIGIAFDGNMGDEYGYVSPPAAVERPWTPVAQSTSGYVRLGDGSVGLVQEQTEASVSPLVSEFQRGVLEAAPIFGDWMEGIGMTALSLSSALGRHLKDYFKNPDPVVADIWFDSDHDDVFGALSSDHIFGKNAPSRDWFSPGAGDQFSRSARESGWIEGYLAWRPVRNLIEMSRR